MFIADHRHSFFDDPLAGSGRGGERVGAQFGEAPAEVFELTVPAEEEPDEVEDAAVGAVEAVFLGAGGREEEPDDGQVEGEGEGDEFLGVELAAGGRRSVQCPSRPG